MRIDILTLFPQMFDGLLSCSIIGRAVEGIKGELGLSSVSTVLLSPQGRLFNQEIARELAGCQNLVLICGHYEGVDERVAEHLVSDEISMGDYLLSGGEVAAMDVVACVIRVLPGVLGEAASGSHGKSCAFPGR